MRRCALLLISLLVACSREPESQRSAFGSRPLPQRDAVDGPRFSRLDPAATGLSFRNELRPENIVAYVYMGAGLAVGDYDQDGLPDVYLVSQDGQNKLFRQTAPLRFEDVTAAAGGLGGGEAWGTAATFADVDGDGHLDLYVCNLESRNLLYQNQGNGTFVEKAGAFGLGVTAASTGAAFADYDNDGDLDLYLLTNRVFRPTLQEQILAEVTLPADVRKSRDELAARDLTFSVGEHVFMAGQQDRLFRNDGYARFVDVTEEAGLKDHGNGLSVVWWDFDGDGGQDIYVANDFQSPDQLYHNNGDGTFRDVTGKMLPHTAFFGMGADFGDIDNDKRMDLCVADMLSTSHYMGKMLMGHMDQHRWFLMNSDPQQYMRNAVYVNTGTERFLEAAHLTGLASTDWTWSVRFADLDEDGRVDFFATNGIPVFADNPDIGDRVKELWQDKRYDEALQVLRTMPRVDEKNIARRNLGNLQFEDVGAAWGLDESGVTHGAVVVDLDRDGDLDIVTNNLNANASVFENRTADSRRVLIELRGADGNHFGVGAQVEVVAGGVKQVRQASLTRGYMSAGEALVHFGLGDAVSIQELTVRWPSGRVGVFTGLSADYHHVLREDESKAPVAAAEIPAARILETRQVTEFVHRERDFDDFRDQPLLPHRLSRLGPGIACGSVVPGGGADIWIGGAAGQSGALLDTGSRLFHAGPVELVPGPWQQDSECEDMGAVFVDFDLDGDLDLYVGSGGVEAGDDDSLLIDRLYVNDGNGVFTRAAPGLLPDLRISTSCVAAADFDRDGDVDLFIGGRVVPGKFPYAPSSALLRNEGGRYVDVTADVAPACRDLGMVSSACWSDLDDDGFVDLVVAAQWQPVRVLGNVGGERLVDRTESVGLAEMRGQWNAVTSCDIDGDGDFDLVVTNLGLNTKYKASADKPLQLFAQDFDGNGTVDVIEAKRSGNDVLPVRGLSCSSQAMPFVREKFPTFDAFARANLGDIYGDALQNCLTLSCTELRHMVLENRKNWFVAHALPREAQISASLGLLVRDLTGNGSQDIMLAHNFFSPEPETGRVDGGLGLMVSHVHGFEFVARPATESGIVLPTDTRGLVFVDGFDQLSIFAATNDGAPYLLSNRSIGLFGTTGPLFVNLVGPDGNPTAIGAKVTLQRRELQPIVREILAGDGYLSQSSPLVSFPAGPLPARLVVRWPDGEQTEHELTATSGPVTLRR